MENTYTHIENQKFLEQESFIPIIAKLADDIDAIDFSMEKPDIRFNYQGRHIGVEVVNCYGERFKKKTAKAKERLYNEIGEYLTSHGISGTYDIYFRDETLDNSHIDDIKEEISEEIYRAIKGTLDNKDYKYIDDWKAWDDSQSPIEDRSFIHPAAHGMYFIDTPAISEIKGCIEKKNKLYDSYDKKLDEIWLLIYIPTRESHYGSSGIPMLSNIDTPFTRIYVSDGMFRSHLIYKSETQETEK